MSQSQQAFVFEVLSHVWRMACSCAQWKDFVPMILLTLHNQANHGKIDRKSRWLHYSSSSSGSSIRRSGTKFLKVIPDDFLCFAPQTLPLRYNYSENLLAQHILRHISSLLKWLSGSQFLLLLLFVTLLAQIPVCSNLQVSPHGV